MITRCAVYKLAKMSDQPLMELKCCYVNQENETSVYDVAKILESPSQRFEAMSEKLSDLWLCLETLDVLELGRDKTYTCGAITGISRQLKGNLPAWRAMSKLAHLLMQVREMSPGLAYCIVLSGQDMYNIAAAKEFEGVEKQFVSFTRVVAALASASLVP